MPARPDSLRMLVRRLEREGELARVSVPVSPVLEVSAIADRVSKSRAPNLPSASAQRTDPRHHDRGGPALLFENVEGSGVPLLINTFGSYRRMEMVLGCEAGGFEAVGERIGELVKPEPPRGLGEVVAAARRFAPLLRIGPKRHRSGPCHEVVRTGADVDLTRLPIIRCWPLDGDFEAVGYPSGINDGIPGLGSGPEWEEQFRGRYITLAGVHTVHADDAGSAKPRSHNIGMYRVQLLGKDRVAMHWHVHHDGASHWRSWVKRGEPMPVAIVLGGEPVLPYAATAPLPPGISELLMAGFLHGSGVPLTRAKTVPLWVPANAEMVIEGYVSHEAGPIGWDPRDDAAPPLGPDAVFEGPFGDHTGFYSMPDRYPVVRVTAVTHRRDPIYPTTVVGLPPQEDYYLGKATERVFLPLLKTLIHDIEDYHLPMFGAFHNCAFVRIKKAYPLQARRVMHAIWGAGQMAWTKTLFVVDEDVDVHDHVAVLRAAAERCHPARDTETVNGPLDILDHAAPRLGAGTKLGFDCTRVWPGEEVRGIEVRENEPIPSVSETQRAEALRLVSARPGVRAAAAPAEIGGWLFVACEKAAPGDGRRVGSAVLEALDRSAHGHWPPFTVVVDPSVDVHDAEQVMFHWCANSDTSRDAAWEGDRGAHSGGRLMFDATSKTSADSRDGQPVRAWPPILRMPEQITERIESRWDEYGLGDVRP